MSVNTVLFSMTGESFAFLWNIKPCRENIILQYKSISNFEIFTLVSRNAGVQLSLGINYHF